MKSSLCSDEIQGQALDEIKSVELNPAKQDFTVCAYRLRHIASFVVSDRRIANFIHQRWISPVEDGFDCVILR